MRADELRGHLAHVGRVSAMGEMAATLAHELNQPLWAVINYVQASMNLLAADADAQRVRDALTKAVEQAERAGGILAGLRQFIAEAAPQRAAESIRALVHEVANLLAPDLVQAAVEIEIRVPEELPRVQVDGVQIQQVVFNLVRNAIEAMPDDLQDTRRISIHARRLESDRLDVSVTDTGAGCDSDTIDRLFDAFYTTKDDGMGMGLAIARTIVEAHDGELVATCTETGGMSIRFDLPIADTSETPS